MTHQVMDDHDPNFFSGYKIDTEPRQLIKARATESTERWKSAWSQFVWEDPQEIDPRSWWKIEDQKQTNSCVGQSLAEGAELSAVISDGQKLDLSRSWSYLASQEASGYLGSDNGADLNGATTAAERGIPLEQDFPWADNYSSMIASYRAKKAAILAGPLYRLKSEVNIDGAEACKRFIGGWTGSVHVGLRWPGFNLVGGWEIHSYTASGRSGHALLMCGYLKVASWPEGYGILMKNSWSPSWGKDGWALVKPSAFDSMMRSNANIGIGRSEMVMPAPRNQVDTYRSFLAS